MYEAGQHEHPGQHDHDEIGAFQDQREGHHRIEQHRQLELVALVVGALGGIIRPAEGAHGKIGTTLPVHCADRARAGGAQQAVHHDGEQHLHEHRVHDVDLGHGDGPRRGGMS